MLTADHIPVGVFRSECLVAVTANAAGPAGEESQRDRIQEKVLHPARPQVRTQGHPAVRTDRDEVLAARQKANETGIGKHCGGRDPPAEQVLAPLWKQRILDLGNSRCGTDRQQIGGGLGLNTGAISFL